MCVLACDLSIEAAGRYVGGRGEELSEFECFHMESCNTCGYHGFIGMSPKPKSITTTYWGWMGGGGGGGVWMNWEEGRVRINEAEPTPSYLCC